MSSEINKKRKRSASEKMCRLVSERLIMKRIIEGDVDFAKRVNRDSLGLRTMRSMNTKDSNKNGLLFSFSSKEYLDSLSAERTIRTVGSFSIFFQSMNSFPSAEQSCGQDFSIHFKHKNKNGTLHSDK